MPRKTKEQIREEKCKQIFQSMTVDMQVGYISYLKVMGHCAEAQELSKLVKWEELEESEPEKE